MEPFLAVFVDGLKPEGIENAEFLDTLYKRRVKTELIGYSPTCHASMYTGIYPNKHLQQFVWRFSPETSPFNVLKKLRLARLPNNIYIKFLINTVVLRAHGVPHPIMFSGLSRQPMENWCYFDFSTVKDWGEPDPIVGDYPTIFKLLKDSGVEYEIIGMKPNPSTSSETVRMHKFNKKIKPFTYLYIGDIDALCCKHHHNSKEVKERVAKIDEVLEEKYKIFEKDYDDFYFMLFSDHGQINVERRIDFYSFFKSNGKNLNDYIHFVDALHLRFWFRNEREKEEVIRILSKLDIGFILTKKIMEKYHAEMPDNRYGDLIFHIDVPYISETCPVKSIHGYLPDYPDSDGVLISNKRLVSRTHIKLQDIAPSILCALDLKIPSYMDGEPIWK